MSRSARATDRVRERAALEREVRAVVRARSGGWCEMRLSGCLGRATDLCHRKPAGAGGRPLNDDLRASNLVDGCRVCHSWTHARPAEAYDMRLALREHQDPAAEPMPYRNAGWVLLTDDGELVRVERVA